MRLAGLMVAGAVNVNMSAVVLVVRGDRAEATLRPVGDWLFGHWPVVVGPLTIVIGGAVLAFGIVQLVSV